VTAAEAARLRAELSEAEFVRLGFALVGPAAREHARRVRLRPDDPIADVLAGFRVACVDRARPARFRAAAPGPRS
jgi:hypothetical protein